FAMNTAIDRARLHGVVFAALGRSNHCGAMDWYTLMAAEADMVGLAGTNALPTMAPWGGADKIVGLNPLSIAMPGAEEPPVVMDIALGATAHGKIRIHAQKGEPIPEGWAFDAAGRPTTDAQAALDGLIQPIGAFKGIGLAMMFGMLSTLFTDAGYGTESGNIVDGAISGADGQFFIAIDIAAFTEPADFKARVDTVVRQFHGSALAPGADAIYVPGAMEHRIAARNRAEGIPLNTETLAGIAAAAAGLGVDISL
ncbi:MAG: Ldh family oxidoreductase, partial [Rhodospirillaceae bacterium]